MYSRTFSFPIAIASWLQFYQTLLMLFPIEIRNAFFQLTSPIKVHVDVDDCGSFMALFIVLYELLLALICTYTRIFGPLFVLWPVYKYQYIFICTYIYICIHSIYIPYSNRYLISCSYQSERACHLPRCLCGNAIVVAEGQVKLNVSSSWMQMLYR